MSKKRKYNTKQGFTLIELLVIIAILVLLVSIVLPSLKHAWEIGRNALCLTNLHSVGRSFQLYLNENNKILPRVACVPSEEPDKPSINILFKPYVEDAEVFHCPGDRDNPTFFETEEISYEYLLGTLYEVDDTPTLEMNFLMTMAKKKINMSRIQVMYDFDEKFHGWTNILYADWHVEK